jgi:signal transduction histidine kinase
MLGELFINGPEEPENGLKALAASTVEQKESVHHPAGRSQLACCRGHTSLPPMLKHAQTLISAIILLIALGLSSAHAADVLTNVRQVKLLSRDTVAGHPVRLRGVVTYFNAQSQQAFLQDASGGIRFAISDSETNQISVKRGQLVEIEGVTDIGDFATFINGIGPMIDIELRTYPVKLKILGDGLLPAPRQLQAHETSNPANHSQRVEMVGVVRQVTTNSLRFSDDNLELELSTTRGRFQAVIPAVSTNYNDITLPGAVLRMSGVYGSISTRFGEFIGTRLLVQEAADIVVEDPGSWNFHQRPVQRINKILRYEPGTGRRMRVQGVVTMQEPGSGFYMVDPGKWLWVQSPQLGTVNVGSVVDVVGFPTKESGAPSLQDAVFTVLSTTNAPIPLAVDPFACMSGVYHGALVTMEGEVVNRYVEPGSQKLLIRSGDHLFQVSLAIEPRREAVALPKPRSRVSFEGICINQFRRRRIIDPDHQSDHTVSSFHIELRSLADVRLLDDPPFWTFARIGWLLLALAGALFLSIGWILALRKQVISQTRFIQAKLAREAVHEERTRIARELHDSLEQNLAGIQMQLDAASGNMERAPGAARETLDMARALLRHSRSETRRSVWELRSTALEGGDLESAFKELMVTLHRNTDVRIAIGKSGNVLSLPTSVENNILRIGQEAVNNAIEHGKARQVSIELDYGPHSIVLRIKDNGRGFDIALAPATREGHFGLVGMKERARKIGATLDIQSAIKSGTVIELNLPNPAEEADLPESETTDA